MADNRNRHKEAIYSFIMGREQETESRRKQMEGLEEEKKGTKGGFCKTQGHPIKDESRKGGVGS